MAGVFVDALVALVHHHLGAPGLCVVGRIVDFECVEQLAVRCAAEPLGQPALGREDDLPLARLLGVNVPRFNHQRVALIPANGIAEPWLDRDRLVLRFRTALRNRDDTRIVHHLDEDHHMIRRLHDLIVVVVDRVQHARPASIGKADQAAFGDGEGFRPLIHRHALPGRCVAAGLQAGG